VRVAILGIDTVAASNTDDPQVIRGIVDRSRKLASPFAGPALLRQYYKHVPLASLAWGILRIDPSRFKSGAGTWSLWFSQPAVGVASMRYLRELHLRGVAFTGSELEAKNIADRAATYLDLFHAAEASTGAPAPDPDIRAFLDSLKIEQQKDRTVLTATAPVGLIRKALAEAPAGVSPEEAPRSH